MERVKNVPRLPADIRISLKKRGRKTYRIELIRQPTGRRFWIRKDGRYSSKVPEVTATQVAERIRRELFDADPSCSSCRRRLTFDRSCLDHVLVVDRNF